MLYKIPERKIGYYAYWVAGKVVSFFHASVASVERYYPANFVVKRAVVVTFRESVFRGLFISEIRSIMCCCASRA